MHMKGQLTKCKNEKLKNFGYGEILVSFSLERIPLLWREKILADEGGPKDPRMLRWAPLMALHGGDGLVVRYTPEFFFFWLGQQIIYIDDLPYVVMDYIGDPDIPHPTGEQWGDLSNNFDILIFFSNFNILCVF